MNKVIWNRPIQIYLSLLVGLQLIPLFWVVPVWVSVLTALLVIWKLLVLVRGIRMPPRWIATTIGFIGLLTVLATKRTLVGDDAATAILTIMAGCKLLESNRYRDIMITLVLCFFLLMAQLIVSQSLVMMGFLIVDVLLLVQLLLQLHPSNTSLLSFRVVGRLLLIILPVWVLLFVAFPRFTVGFWQRESPIGQTGFSEDMNPGNVSRLVESDGLAFRVQFQEKVTNPESLYWRGSVLSVSNGLHWFKHPVGVPYESFDTNALQKQSKQGYRVFLEPFFQRWIFALDYFDPTQRVVLPGISLNRRGGLIFEASRNIHSRVTYDLKALRQELRQFRLTETEQRTFLQLPNSIEPRVKELAKNLRSADGKVETSIEKLRQWFIDQKFSYSLTPGQTPGGNVGGFLFESKIGFCEHFAAAAAVLLRAMGHPARVVLGFQGADWNELGDYWIVRNRNAHAWTEVWVDEPSGGYWKRLDLVSVVNPMRIIMGADYFRIAAQIPAGVTNPNDERIKSLARNFFTRAQLRLQLLFDAAEMQWIQFLMAYDFEFQQNLISKLGIQNASRLTFFAILAVALAGLFLAILFYAQRQGNPVEPELKLWRKFCQKMAKRGLLRLPAEGPADFLRRVKERFPDQSQELSEVGDIYIKLRYGKQANVSDQARLRILIQNL